MFSPGETRVDLPDRFRVIKHQEDTYYKVADYLSPEFQAHQGYNVINSVVHDVIPTSLSSNSSTTSSSSTLINDMWREKICEWNYQVIDHFGFNREVVAISLNYLDRYIVSRPVNKKVFQLAAMTSLYLAIKIHEPGRLKMSSLLELSRGYFMIEHVVAMEEAILRCVSSLACTTFYGRNWQKIP